MTYPTYNQSPYMNNYANQFYQPQMAQPIQQPISQSVQQPINQPQQFVKSIGLQGKSVDNIEVVKATDIPLDGSISYFPLMDGSAIVTKQLMQDGTSKITIYQPVNSNEKNDTPKYITEKELDEKIKKITPIDFSSDIKNLKRQLKGLEEDLDEIKNKGE